MADFYALGELLIDFTPAGKTPAGIPIFEQNPGGAPANVAVQAARLGVSAGFIGKVGQDMFGTFLRDTLVKQNVDVENLHFSNDTATSLAFVQLSESGDRDFSFYRNPGADTQITFDEVNKDALANAKVLCFGSLLLTAEPGRTAVPQIVSYAREHGAITAYDPNWRAPLWPNAEAGIHAMKSLLPLADVVKASDEERRAGGGHHARRKGLRCLHPENNLNAQHLRYKSRRYHRLRRQLLRRVPHKAHGDRQARFRDQRSRAARCGRFRKRRRLRLCDEKRRDSCARRPQIDRNVQSVHPAFKAVSHFPQNPLCTAAARSY